MAGGEALYVKADVLVEDEVQAFIDRAASTYGRLDVAFNNAGITIEKPLHEYSAAEWDRVNNTNLRGVFLAMKYQIPHMLKAGGGTIVVTSSSTPSHPGQAVGLYGQQARPGRPGQAVALDYALQGIRVNALIPARPTRLPAQGSRHGERAGRHLAGRAEPVGQEQRPGLGRLATAEEIAAMASPWLRRTPFMTGAQIVIDGGKTAKAG